MAKKNNTNTIGVGNQDLSIKPVATSFVKENYTPYTPGTDFNLNAAINQVDLSENIISPFQDNWLNVSGKYGRGAAWSPLGTQSIRGERQGWFKQIVNGLVGNTIGIGTKVGRGVGSALGFVADSYANIQPGEGQLAYATNVAKKILNKDVTKKIIGEDKTSQMPVYDVKDMHPHKTENAIINFFETIENDIVKEKLLPVYPNLKYNSGELLKQMATSKFWADDFADAVAFAISAYAPVAAMGKTAQLFGLSKKAEYMFKALTTAGYNTLTEASFEAKGVKDIVKEDLAKSVYGTDYMYLNDDQKEEIDDEAGIYAANTFNSNLGILALSNLVQARFYLGPIDRTSKKLLRGIRAGTITPNDIKVGKRMLKSVAMGIPSESLWEEGMQNAIQEYETSLATGEAFLDNKAAGYVYEWLKGFTTLEGQKSMMLGGIIGGGMGAISAVQDVRGERQRITEHKNAYERIAKNLKTYNNSLIEDIKHFYKDFDITEESEDGGTVTKKSIVDKDGNSQIDLDKVFKMYINNVANKRIFDNLIMAALNSDPVHQKFIENEALQRIFYRYITNPIFESNEAAYETLLNDSGIKELSESAELKQAGIEFSDIKAMLDQMNTTWKQVEDTLFDRDDIYADEEQRDFKTFLTKALFYEQNKMNILDSLEDQVKDKEQLDMLRDDTQQLIDVLEDNKQHEKIYEEYKNEKNYLEGLAKKYTEEASKDPQSLEARKAKYLYEEASIINGDPGSSSSFSILQSPAAKTGELGLKNQHFLDIGLDSITGARLEAEIESAKQGRSTLSDVVGILDNPVQSSIETRGKKDISKEDIAAVREVIPIEKKRIDDNRYTEEERDRDLMNVDIAVHVQEITPDDAPKLKKEIRDKFNAMRIAENQFNKALERLNEIEEFANGDGLLNYKDRIPKKVEDDTVFQRKVADIPVGEAEDISQAYKSNPDSYDNLRKVERVIENLQDRKEIYQETDLKERLDKNQFKGFIEGIESEIANLTDNILPKVKENYNETKNLDSQSQINKNQLRFRGLGIDIDQDNNIIIRDQDLYDLISEAIGITELENILEDAKEAAELGTTYAFHEIFVDKILIAVKNSDLKSDILERLKGKLEVEKKEFGELFKDLHSKVTQAVSKSINKILSKYITNPKKVFKDILVSISGDKTGEGKFAFDVYKKDNDVLRYYTAIQEEENPGYNGWSNEYKQRITTKHLQIEALQDAVGYLESKFDINTQIKNENSHFVDLKLAPTNQQVSAIRQVIRWFLSPVKKVSDTKKTNHRFKNWSFLKGIAGSGKTQVVLGYIINSLGLKSDEVTAIAPHRGSAMMIKESITLANDPVLARELDEKGISEKTKLVVIDEVAAFNDIELVNLANKLQEINEGRETKFKVISLGDPSQISKQQPGVVMSTEPEINRNTIDGVNYIEVIDPLTVAHRSLIDENNELMDVFADNESKVTGITTYAKDPVGFDTIGIHSGTRQQMEQQLQAIADNGKSKAIAVYGEKEKASLASRFPELKDNIFTFSEIAGREFDQVFVDLNRDNFLDDTEFNKAMYTAISRHKQYAFVVDHTGTFNNKQKNISFNTEDRKRINDERRKEYEKRIDFEKSVLKGAALSDIQEREQRRSEEQDHDRSPITDDTEDKYEDPATDDETGKEEEDSYDNRGGKIIGGVPYDEGISHELQYPSHTGSKFIDKKDASAKLIPNGDVIYVKTTDKTGEYPYTVHVLGQLYDAENNPIQNRYAHLGIVSEEELTSEFGAELMKQAEEKAVKENKEGGTDDLFNAITIDRVSNVANLKYSEGEIFTKTVLSGGKLKLSQPLYYKYSNKVTHTGSGMLERIIDLFNHKYLKRAKESASYRVEIFYDKTLPEGEGRFSGVPYLVIDPVSSTNNQKRTQYIRLNPAKIDYNNKWIIHLRNFRDAIKPLMDLTGGRLGDKTFNSMVYLFARNYHVVDDKIEFKEKKLSFRQYTAQANKGFVPKLTKAEFNQVTDIMTPIIEGVYGPGMVKREFLDEQEMKEAYSLDENNENDDSRYEFIKAKNREYGYALRYDKNNPESKGIYEYQMGLKAGGGTAQTAINVLAKANEYIGDKRIRVRVRKQRSYTGEKLDRSVRIITGKSLTASSAENNTGYYQHLRRLAKEHDIDLSITAKDKQGNETEYILKYVTDDTVEFFEDKLVKSGIVTKEDLEELQREHLNEPIRIEDLNQIVDDFRGGRHTQLRTPLEIDYINRIGDDIDANREELDNLLETNIEDILPTRVVVQPDKNVSTRPEPSRRDKVDEDTRNPVTDIGKEISKRFKGIPRKNKDDKGKPLSSAGNVILGEKRSERSIRRKIKKMIPDLTDREVRFMEKLAIDKMMGKPSWGMFKDGVMYLAQDKEGNTYENIARHEVLHKIWNEYLTPEERDHIEKLFKEEFGDFSKFSDIEEMVAVKFHEWRRGKLKKIADSIRLFFVRLLSRLGVYQDNIKSIDDLFARIERGMVDRRMANGDFIGKRALFDIRDRFGSVNNYLIAYEQILSLLKKYRSPISEGYPKTIKEVIDSIKADLREAYYIERKALNDGASNQHTVDLLKIITANYDTIINDIFPDNEIFQEGIYLSDLEEDLIKRWSDEKALVNLKEHIIENSRLNNESTVTKEVKEFLSYVQNRSGDFLSWRYVYVKMIDLFEGLNLEQDNIEDQLRESFRTEQLNDNEQAILSHVISLINTIEDNLVGGVKIPDTMKFINYDIFVSSDENVNDVNGPEHSDVRNGKVTIIQRKRGESTEGFINRIATEQKLDSDIVAHYMRQMYANTTFSRLASHFNSHRQRNPMIGERKSNYGGYEITYINARGNAVSNGIKSVLRIAIANKFTDKKTIHNFIDFTLRDWNNQYKIPVQFVKQFLKYIGLNEYATSLKDKNSKVIVDDIRNFFERARIVGDELNKGDEIEITEQDINDENEVSDTYTIGMVLNMEGNSLLNHLASSVALLDDLSRILSSTDIKGEKRYNAVLTSQAHKNIYGIINAKFKAKSIGNLLSLKIRNIFFNSLYKNNIFINGINKIHRLIDDDGHSFTLPSGKTIPVQYQTERRNAFNFRTFVLGFLTHAQTTGKRTKYIQYIYPNERKTPFGVEVDLLDRDKLIKGIGSTIKQLVTDNKEAVLKNKNYNKDKLIGFEVLREVIGERELSSIKDSEIESIAKDVYNKLDEKSRSFTEQMINDQMLFDSKINKNTSVMRKIDRTLYPDYNFSHFPVNKGGYVKMFETMDDVIQRTGLTREQVIEQRVRRKYLITADDIQPMSSLFYINNYLNGYHFTQLAAGDLASFKNSDDLTKRLSIAFAPGKAGFVNSKYGMREKARVAVVEDPVENIDSIEKFLKKLLGEDEDITELLNLFGKEYEPADGQGFALPERFEDIEKGFGQSYGNVLKPVYYSINEDGTATAMKYSVVKLSDELCERYSQLNTIREKMRNKEVDELVFSTVMKVGEPSVLSNWDALVSTDPEIAKDIEDGSIIDVDNRDYRIQLDPSASLDSSVANPTQLSYLLRLYGKNDQQAQDAYKSIARIAQINFNNFVKFTQRPFNSVMKSLTKRKGYEMLKNILDDGIDYNFPSISDRLLVQFISGIYHRAVEIRYPGSKFVLQTSVGVEKQFADRILSYGKDNNGGLYAEVIVPKGFLPKEIEAQIQKSLDRGEQPEDLFYASGKPSREALGFRIPSSELHSAVALKIVGFYDSEGTNVIIAPKELVPIHGSDFDVDSLFVIKRMYHDGYSTKSPVGYIKEGNRYTFEFDEKKFIERLPKDLTNKEKLDIEEAYHMNRVMENYLGVILDPQNIKRMLSPISMTELDAEKDRIIEETKQKDTAFELSDIVDSQRVHNSLFTGEIAIGMFMNMMKAVSFLHKATKGHATTKIRQTFTELENGDTIETTPRISFNDNVYDEIKDIDEEGKKVGYRFDALANAALDNLKVRILSFLNITRDTIRAYSIMVAHGIKTSTINNFISQPILRYLSINGDLKYRNLVRAIESNISATEIEKIDTLHDERMKAYLKEDPDMFDRLVDSESLTDSDIEYLAYQVKVASQFDTLKKLGDGIAKISSVVNIMSKMPVETSELESILSSAKSIFGIEDIADSYDINKSTFPYLLDTFFDSNPHIKQMLQILEWSVGKISSKFIKYSKQYRKVANKALKDTGVSLDNNIDISKKKTVDEFVKYLLSTMVDRSMIDHVYWTNRDGDVIKSEGVRAFNRRFVNFIRKAQNEDYKLKLKYEDYQGNMFLNSLNIVKDPISGREKIFFHGPSTMDVSDFNLYRKSFEELDTIDFKKNKKGVYEYTRIEEPEGYTDFQKMFVTYAMINYGMSFGLRNYSSVLPGDIYKQESDRFVKKMKRILKLNQDELNNMIDHFETQLVVNYPDNIPSMGIKPVEQSKKTIKEKGKNKEITVYSGKDGDIYFDRKFVTETERKWPKYYKEKFGADIKIFHRVSDEEAVAAYYVVVDRKSRDGIYDIDSIDTATSYNISDSFNARVRHVNGTVTKTGIIRKVGYDLDVDDIIKVSNYSDPAKLYGKHYIVTEKVGTNSYRLEEVPVIKEESYFKRPNNEVERVANKIYDILRRKANPFNVRKGGKIYYMKHKAAEARNFRNYINEKYFDNESILKERSTSKGIEIYIDMELLAEYIYGKQLTLLPEQYKDPTIIEVDEGVADKVINMDLLNNDSIWDKVREDYFVLNPDHDFALQSYIDAYDGKDMNIIIDDIESRTKEVMQLNDEDGISNEEPEFRLQMINLLKKRLKGRTVNYEGHRSDIDGYGNWDPVRGVSLDYVKFAYSRSGPLSLYDTDRAILHELGHEISAVQVDTDIVFQMQIKELMDKILEADPKMKAFYGMGRPSDFISEFYSNYNFVQRLKTIKVNGKNFVRRIIEAIARFFGFDLRSTAYKQFQRFMNWNLRKPPTLSVDENGNILVDGKKKAIHPEAYDTYNKTNHLRDIVDQGAKYTLPEDEIGNQEDFYSDPEGNKYRRITDIYNGVISFFRKGDLSKKKTYGERQADFAWKYLDKDKSQKIDLAEEESYDEYKERQDKIMIEGIAKGRIVHKMFQKYIDIKYNNGLNENRINAEIQNIAYSDHTLEDSEGNEYVINVNIDPAKYSWVEENMEKILLAHGIDVRSTTAEDLRDIVVSEVTIASELLGWAGSADLVVEHSDGRMSIKDIKTGYNFDNVMSSRLLKYGERRRNIHDSPRDRAKMQVMLYAFMSKLNNPDLKFRDLSVMWIPGRYHATNIDMMRKVDVNDFLEMIQLFLKDKTALKEAGLDENIYQKVIEKAPKIFNPSEYTDEYTETTEMGTKNEREMEGELIDQMRYGDKSPEALLEAKITELTVILGKAPVITRLGKSKFENLSYKDRVRARLLTHHILQLLQDPSTSFTLDPNMDVSMVSSWIGNYSELSIPHIQTWKKFRDEMDHKASIVHQVKMNKFRSLLRPVHDDYYKKHPNLLRHKRILNWANYKKIYGFAYKEFEYNGAKQLRLIHEGDAEYNNLTNNQQKLLDFINDQYQSYFDEKTGYLHQTSTIIDEYGKKRRISILEQHNREVPEGQKRNYYRGWFPKIPKEQSEMIYDFGEGSYIKGLTNKNFIKDSWMKSVTFYEENQYEGRNVKGMVLPVKYLGSFAVDNKRDYSYSIQFQFDRFIKNIEYKRHMDPVYALGESVRGYLSMVKYKDQPMFTNAVDMFEKKLISDVLSRSIRGRYSRKPILLSGSNFEDREVRGDALLHLARNWVSATIMWLRPFQGGGNGLHATFLKHKEGLKGTIAGKVFGIKEDAIDYTLSDSLYADTIYFSEHIPNAILGNLEKDKTWLMLKKLDYMPDNFDFKSPEKYLLSARNWMISRTSMYSFHRLPEEFVSMTTMIAQLRHLKHPTLKNENGKPKSLWDCYEVVKDPETGEYDVEWKGGRRGYIKTGKGDNVSYTEMNELVPQEIAKLKKIYERMQGGYRKEEAAAIEAYVLGKVFIQLKKYIPRLILNAFASKREEKDLGKWIKTQEIKDGESVFEWVGRMNDSRWKVLGFFMLNMLTFDSAGKNYSWNQLDDEQKQHLIDAALTMMAWFITSVGYTTMFGDDKDDDTLKKWWKMYLMDNLGQQYNPAEMLKLVTQGLQPVAFVRAGKTMNNATKMLVATWNLAWGAEEDKIFTDQDQLKGWYEIRKSIPLVASYADLMNKIKNTESLEEGLFADMPNKWR